MLSEIRSIVANDPAVKGSFLRKTEVILYPCLYTILAHRFLAHPLYRWHVPFVPRLISQVMRFLTGIEIHPGARISPGLFIDHGMGTVIGETVSVGRDCIMFHGVTLGGTGNHAGKRHPTIGDRVTIGAHSTLLGPISVGNDAKIGAETVIIMHDVPAKSTVVGAPGRIVRTHGERVDRPLPPTKPRA